MNEARLLKCFIFWMEVNGFLERFLLVSTFWCLRDDFKKKFFSGMIKDCKEGMLYSIRTWVMFILIENYVNQRSYLDLVDARKNL